VLLVTVALTPAASACDRVNVEVDGVDVDVDVSNCGWDWEDYEDEDVEIEAPRDHDQRLDVQYGMQFLPRMPGHQLGARFTGDRDTYLSGELRYTPVSDLLWTARLGAGVDVFGRSDWNLNLGLFLGSAGEWDRRTESARLYAAPIAGTELGLGYDGDRLFGGYRWLGGIGGGPVDELLTENELTLGYKVFPAVHVYGQYLVLSPGELDNQAGIGLGGRVSF
jgi:hypothetical protein